MTIPSPKIVAFYCLVRFQKQKQPLERCFSHLRNPNSIILLLSCNLLGYVAVPARETDGPKKRIHRPMGIGSRDSPPASPQHWCTYVSRWLNKRICHWTTEWTPNNLSLLLVLLQYRYPILVYQAAAAVTRFLGSQRRHLLGNPEVRRRNRLNAEWNEIW